MSGIAQTPKPPYYAVIFTSLRTEIDGESGDDGYAEAAEALLTLAAKQPGFLGVESARDGLGITVSYWKDLESIRAWKRQARHMDAQHLGRERWYSAFRTRIARVEDEHGL